jgi:hypothetical protein
MLRIDADSMEDSVSDIWMLLLELVGLHVCIGDKGPVESESFVVWKVLASPEQQGERHQLFALLFLDRIDNLVVLAHEPISVAHEPSIPKEKVKRVFHLEICTPPGRHKRSALI